jgi:hypothetical protein
MRSLVVTLALLLASCAALDAPVQVADPVTGDVIETPLGDVVADNADSVASTVGQFVGGINPTLGLLAAGAVGTLLAGARRKKKPLS